MLKQHEGRAVICLGVLHTNGNLTQHVEGVAEASPPLMFCRPLTALSTVSLHPLSEYALQVHAFGVLRT